MTYGGEVRLDTLLTNISSNRQRERTDGLNDLKVFFERSRKAPNLFTLSDKSYCKVFEDLFKVVVLEKQSYLKSKKSSKQLENCAEAIRSVVQVAVTNIKSKTVDLFLTHHIFTLSTPDGTYFQPLTRDYLRNLCLILDYAPHVEHLKVSRWLQLVDFCLQGVDQYLDASPQEPSSWTNCFSSSDSYRSGTRTVSGSGKNGSSKAGLSRQNIEDLFQAIFFLVSAPNSPVLERYAIIIDTAIKVLKLQGFSLGKINQLAFAIINVILRFTRINRIPFTQSIILSVLTIISRIFPGKPIAQDEMLNSLKDEMLILIFHIHPHLECMIRDKKFTGVLSKIEDLLEIMKHDYSKRSDRDQLQLDDLEMIDHGVAHCGPFNIDIFHLRIHNSRTERNWAILQAIGIFERLVSQFNKPELIENTEKNEHPLKRQRTCKASDRLVEPLKSDENKLRLVGLKVIPFVLDNLNIPPHEVEVLLDQLGLCAAEKRDDIRAWALLAISSCTFQAAASNIGNSEWLKIWRIGIRSLAHSSTCRSASVVLHSLLAKELIQAQNVREDIDLILTATEINGPLIISDSSIPFMAHLLNTRVKEVSGVSTTVSQSVLRWLFARWKPVEKNFAMSHAKHVQPKDIILFFRTCLGLERLPTTATDPPRGYVAQAWQNYLDERDVLDYLLLSDKLLARKITQNTCNCCPNGLNQSDSITFTLPTSKSQSTQKLILDLSCSTCHSVLQDWRSYVKDRSSPISCEMYFSTLSYVISMLLITSSIQAFESEKLQDFSSCVMDLAKEIAGPLNHLKFDSSKESNLIETLAQTIQPYLPSCRSHEIFNMMENKTYFLEFLSMVTDQLKKNRDASAGVACPDVSMIDFDDDFRSPQEIQAASDTQRLKKIPRNPLDLAIWPDSFNITVRGKLYLLDTVRKCSEFRGVIPSTFFDYILSLSNEEFLSSRELLLDIFNSDLMIDSIDTNRVIEQIGNILASDSLDRCDITLLLCIDILGILEPLWSGSYETELAESSAEIYRWLINTVLGKNLASPEVQKSISNLLMRLLCGENPNYGKDHSTPSAELSLYAILRDGDIAVKFHVAAQLPIFFQKFALKSHDTVFMNILNNLPFNVDWIEGISFRLFALAEIGSTWPNLLRRCIYHIFETAGETTESTNHATRCLKDISSKLEVNDAQELFLLFASQILYTWLGQEEEDVRNIPFKIFGFNSLHDLFKLAKNEATALMLMRGQRKFIQQLTSVLGIDENCLVRDAFTKAMAYCISYDLSYPNIGGEKDILRILGEEVFFHSLNFHFADIIAILFSCLDHQSTADKHFLKLEDLRSAGNIIKQIKSFSSSAKVLPSNQQPLFNVKYLAGQIQHLCSRMQCNMNEIFTPTMVVSLARFLFNSIHPALGSLHACSVLQRLRVLISMAGDTATAGYPLEMLLQSLCPFIQDPECADDTIGTIQYLLSNGSVYLRRVPSFFAGTALSLLWFLRQLDSIVSTPSQDSQRQNTKVTSQRFHAWLGKYLRNYSSLLSIDISTKQHFLSLVEAALCIQPTGNSEEGIAECNLLIELLKDESSEKKLLSRPSRDTILLMLTTKFTGSTSYKLDAFGDDERLVNYVPAIWRSCREFSNKKYQAWAGKLLGKAFASSGLVHKEMLQESNLARIIYYTEYFNGKGSSVQAILNLLRELTLSRDLQIVGIAEAALRKVLTAADKDLAEICKSVLPESLFCASTWLPYQLPPSDHLQICRDSMSISELLDTAKIKDKQWFRDISIEFARSAPGDPILATVASVISKVPGFNELTFPFIIHLMLSSRFSNTTVSKRELSHAFNLWFTDETIENNHKRLLIDSILYLRTQVLPGEKSPAQRASWLDIDYYKATLAACSCGMFKTALLFIEGYESQPISRSRRSSSIREVINLADNFKDVLLQIYMNIDDPDLYYGVKQNADLSTVLARFEYEKDGLKGMTFKGAQYDSHIRKHDPASVQDLEYLVRALDVLNMSGISNSLLRAHQIAEISESSIESLFHTSRKLEKWDIPIPSTCSSNSVAIYKVFLAVNTAFEHSSIDQAIDEGLRFAMSNLVKRESIAKKLHESLQTLAVFVEMDDVLRCRGSEQFESIYTCFQKRSHWMKLGRFDDINFILSCRGTMLSTLSQKPDLQSIMNIRALDSRLVEVQTALLTSKLYHAHGALREALCHATSMTDLIDSCHAVDVNPDVAINLEVASALWEQGEVSSSIGILWALDDHKILEKQTIVVGRSHLLIKIGRQISIAKLEKAEKIIEKYLEPALKELKGEANGCEAGQVFHQFATFCDQQLQNPDSLEEIERVRQLSKNKLEEVQEYDKLIAKAKSSESKRECYSRQVKAKAWLKIDERDLNRLEASREGFLSQSLENYLRALIASNDHDKDALRFLALWLEHSGDDLANSSVAKYLKNVPSMKFATLMNQLTSRLQESKEIFQELLFQLILRICSDHPYHGMYQIFAGAFSDTNGKDEASISRRNSTKKLIQILSNLSLQGKIWGAVETISKAYCFLAGEKNNRYRSGKKFNIVESSAAKILNSALKKHPAPSLTMNIPLSASLDYSKVPSILRMEPEFSIASGVSAPKIIDVKGDNGIKYKQLVKGGNDDLRQDAIMEQVFEQVSELLKTNRSTRQRNLSIRTYRVIPLTNVAGVIEFVPNTISLHEYLIPAHERFFPEDLKAGQCRNEISAVQARGSEVRIKVFKAVTERFHPVMRFFFTEKFHDPDEWFEKRLTYVRSTAANSILGHVLGLGDRHANNILVDQDSGEIVHIDLGIAFEMGRILPIPETVPFRLTRDIVDGMGISKTEGVFRRCCEFTLEALQHDSYSIMSILDVLRYDPLYSWSVSPVRLAKLREEQDALDVAARGTEKTLINEPGEAARALSGISKKLTKFLSVYATVNDLINQASDERNLALLFAGWAAYA